MKRNIGFLFVLVSIMVLSGCQLGTHSDHDISARQILDAPNQAAWNLFLHVNQSRDTGTLSEKGPRLWQTWKSSDEVYLHDGSAPAAWGEHTDLKKALLKEHKMDHGNINTLLTNNATDDVSFAGGNVLDNNGQPIWYEVRMNKHVFEYIVSNELYNVDGQIALFNNATRKVNFPIDSMELKLAWKILDPKTDDVTSYYTSEVLVKTKTGHKEATVGLVGMHIVSKLIPQWFWMTFEYNKNAEVTQIGKETLATPKEVVALNKSMQTKLKDTVWKNYRLRGTQTDFTTPTGIPTRLSNTVIETYIQQSSCIGCHSMAVIGAKGARINDFDTNLVIGTPDPKRFVDKRGLLKFKQLDFVFSLLEASKKK
jgi:hypothetical protein